MWNLDRKIYLLLITFLALHSCKEAEAPIETDSLEVYSKKYFTSYKTHYGEINTSIAQWLHDSLSIALPYYLYPYQVDSVICFNSDSTRLFSTINCRIEGVQDAKGDNIREIGGAKIHGNWYFLLGASWPISRIEYQDSMYAPLTFKELSYIAHQRIFPKHRFDPQKNKWSFDTSFFEATFYESIPECKGRSTRNACYDSVWLAKWEKLKTEKLSPSKIEHTKLEMQGSARPSEPYEARTWWERFRDPFKPKVFGRKREEGQLE